MRTLICSAAAVLTLLAASAAGARELDELEGVVYSDEVPPYALDVAADARIPPPLAPTTFPDPEMQQAYHDAYLLRRILLQLPCYCNCHGRAGHKSLYACFVAPVGSACYSAECGICLDEGRMAKEMHAEGASAQDIRAALEARYGGAHGAGDGHGH